MTIQQLTDAVAAATQQVETTGAALAQARNDHEAALQALRDANLALANGVRAVLAGQPIPGCGCDQDMGGFQKSTPRTVPAAKRAAAKKRPKK